MRRHGKDIGDLEFPLEANAPEEVSRDHDHVGKRAEVSPHADKRLRSIRGEEVSVTGVVLKSGQIAGYEVKHEGKTYLAPKSSFYVDLSILEDIHLDTAQARHIRSLMSHFQGQKDYYSTSWDGIEAFHFQLAKATQVAAVDSAGWFSFPGSSVKGWDGKNWRLIVPSFSGATAVNCHSLLHDNVWTLSTTIFSTRDTVDMGGLRFFGSEDHWTRTLVWSIAVALNLQKGTQFRYDKPIQQFQTRLRCNRILNQMVQKLWGPVERALQEQFQTDAQMPPLSTGFGTIRVEPNHVGRYEHPSDECPYGILTVHPKVWSDKPYLFEIVKHELIHHALAAVPGERKPHDDDFKAMANALGLPKKYQD
jgi:hypothetical protein